MSSMVNKMMGKDMKLNKEDCPNNCNKNGVCKQKLM